MKKILFAIPLFLLLIPIVNAGTVGQGAYSRVPIGNHTIEQDFTFDGSNYNMITKYGNYTFLDPHYIMSYTNLEGEEIIDKSIWVLQHDTWGTWEALEDFENLELYVNETRHILTYGINVKSKGKNYIIANVSLEFYSSEYSRNIPKIIVNMTKTAEWDSLGYGNYRWIWNIVPKGNYFKYINQTAKETVDIRAQDIQGNTGKIYFTNNESYSHLNDWMLIDVTDYGIVEFKGGNEDYWNGKGFSLIFPENEGYIDPTTIEDGFDATVTAIEQQRTVFKNPRGLGYYYSYFWVNNANGNCTWFKSVDGVTWEVANDFFIIGMQHMDIVFWENETDSRLIVSTVHKDVLTEDLWFHSWGINDTLSDVQHLDADLVAVETDDAIHNPNIEIDVDGFVWVTWTDEFTNKGKQRNQLRVTRSDSTYPILAPIWEAIVDIYGEQGSAEHGDGLFSNGPMIRSEIVQVSDFHNVSVVFSFRDDSGPTFEMLGVGLTAPLGAITEDNLVNIDLTMGTDSGGQNILHSSVAESGADSDVFILYTDAQGFHLELAKWDISADSSANYGTVWDSGGNTQRSLSLSINRTANPDILYCFWSNVTAGSFWVDYTEVDSFELEGIWEVDGEVQALDYFSSSGVWNESIQLIYTMANNTVRFYELDVPPEIIYPDAPDHLFGAGFNGSLGFIELYWNHSLANYTDFEVHNSTLGVSFVFLVNVSDPWYNHTGQANMTYNHYRVRARNYMDWYGQYFNSSWSDVNLERVYFNRTVAGGGGPIAGGSGAIGFLMIILILVPIIGLLWRKLR